MERCNNRLKKRVIELVGEAKLPHRFKIWILWKRIRKKDKDTIETRK